MGYHTGGPLPRIEQAKFKSNHLFGSVAAEEEASRQFGAAMEAHSRSSRPPVSYHICERHWYEAFFSGGKGKLARWRAERSATGIIVIFVTLPFLDGFSRQFSSCSVRTAGTRNCSSFCTTGMRQCTIKPHPSRPRVDRLASCAHRSAGSANAYSPNP